MRHDRSVRRDDSARLPRSRWALGLLFFAFALGATLAGLARQHELATAQGAEADLWVMKGGESWKWPESTPFRYHFTVRNHGPDTAVNVVVTDTMPAGMQFVSASSPQVPGLSCGQSDQTVWCYLGNVPNQGGGMETWTVDFDVITPEVQSDPTYVTNAVSITSDTSDPQTGDNQSSDEIWVQNVVTDLWVDETGPATAVEDTDVAYSTFVHNDDDWTARGVVLTYIIPTGSFVSADLPCTVNDYLVTCPVGDFPALGSATYHLTLHPSFGSGPFTTGVSISSSTEDDDLSDNADSVETSVLRQQTHLQIDKSGPAQVVAGGDVGYTITLHNGGSFAARQVWLHDQPPSGWALIGSGALPCAQHGNGQIDCEVGDVPAGATQTYSLVLRVPTGQPVLPENVANGAWYTTDTPDPDPTNNYDDATTTILPTVPTAPGRPGGSSSYPQGVYLGWGNPAWTGGTPVRTCTVTAAPGGATLTTDDCAGSGGGSGTMTGLSPGVAYTFTVRATNDVGDGPASEASDPVLYVGPPPDPPTSVTAVAGDGEATVSWAVPANTGGSWPIGFEVVSSPGDVSVSVGYESSAVVTGLTNGTAYTSRVRATSGYGDGPWSDPSNPVTTIGLPGAPTNVQAIAGNASAQVTWSAPGSDGGSPITGYRVRVVGGAEQEVPASPRAYLMTGLTNGGTYTFQVAARNAQGLGPWSAPSGPVTPQSLPGPPTDVQANAGDGQAVVSWQPPADAGGHPIMSYTVVASPGGGSATVMSSPATISGLTNGTTYTFSVRATTTVGTGPAGTSPPVTPAGLPGVPTGVHGTPQVEAIQVSWNPSDANGSPITHYDVKTQPGGAVTTVESNPPSTTVDELSPLTAYTFRVRAHNGVGTGPWSAWSAAVIPAAPPARFFALSNPDRILDTRTSPVPVGYPSGKPLTGGSHLDLQVTGVAGVPDDASAVVLNLTAVVPSAPTHLTVWPTGQPMPTASNLNVGTGEVAANLVIVKLGDGGRVSIFNNSGAVHVVADVTGYDADDPSGSLLTGVQPKRLVDSRDGTGTPKRPWDAASSRNVTIAGGATTVPSGATAVVLDVTAVWPTEATHLTVWPTGQPMPWVSNLNLPANDIRPNLVIVRVGTNRQISIYNNSGKVDVVADVVAYFDATATNGLFTGVQPVRVLDSRDGTGGYGSPWGPATTRPVTVTGGTTSVPPGATAVVVNLTAVLPSEGTHLTVWPTGQPLPWVSNLNLGPGDVRPNLVVVKVGDGGQISIYNNSGRVAVVADIVGYYSGP